jgi:hypothetical protein
VKTIVNYFYVNRKYTDGELEPLGDDSRNPEIGQIIRQKLCPAISTILSIGFKVGVFSNTHIWHLIEEAAELKKSKYL